MYCKECGTENQDDSLRCYKCNTYLKSSDSPLTGGDRVKVISFFIFLILPFVWFGFGAVVVLIALISIYIMKKDQSFQPIVNAKKYMKVYLIVVALFFTVIASIVYYQENDTIIDYKRYDQAKKYNPNVHFWEYIIHNPKVEIQTGMVAVAGLVVTLIAVFFFMYIFNNLFFRPLEEHRNWITKNGVFSDEKDKKSDSTNIVGRDNLNSYSVADEMLKWNDLLEKGLITQEEFEKAKAKLLNREKV